MRGNIIGRVVVAAVDGSNSARHAALWAATDADRRRLPVRLVHVVTIPAVPYTGGQTVDQGYVDAMVKLGNDVVATTKAEIAELHPDLEVYTEVLVADLVRTLVAESESAAMTVLGSHGLGGFSGMLAGSTAVALVAHAHSPVAVIRGRGPEGTPPPGGPVVVGVDGSPASGSAVELAFEEASLRGADLVAVHTWTEYASDSAYTYARQFVLDWDAIEASQREILAERLAGLQERYPDVVVRRIVTRARPVSALLEQSATAQLLVVGSRGHGGFTGMLLGSTSQALVYHATCPLLVVRGTSAADG